MQEGQCRHSRARDAAETQKGARAKVRRETSGEDDGGSGTSPDDDERPARHGLEMGSEMSRPSGVASDGALAKPYRITFDKDNPVGFALRGPEAEEQH